MQTIGSYVLMAGDDLAGTAGGARRDKPEGVLLLYRHREINETSLAAFVHAFLATLQRDELHIDLIGQALVRSGFVDEAHDCAAPRHQHLDEGVALVADILMEQVCADLVLERALVRMAGEVLLKLTAPPPATPLAAAPPPDCHVRGGARACPPVSTRIDSAESGRPVQIHPVRID
jgi:hypothetical protein